MSGYTSLPGYVDIAAKNGKFIIDNDKHTIVNKFGLNIDVDTGTLPEDCWYNGGVYTFTASPAVLAISSDSSDDDITGTGARQIQVEGLDANFKEITEVVDLDGTNTVNTTQVFARLNRAYNVSAGSGGVNAGSITISDGVNTVGLISVGNGQTLMAIYTIPKDYNRAYLASVDCDVIRSGNSGIEVFLQIREENGPWRTRDILAGGQNSNGAPPNELWSELQPGSDMRMRINYVSADNTRVSARFSLLLLKN